MQREGQLLYLIPKSETRYQSGPSLPATATVPVAESLILIPLTTQIPYKLIHRNVSENFRVKYEQMSSRTKEIIQKYLSYLGTKG